jgi:hypothetical protein
MNAEKVEDMSRLIETAARLRDVRAMSRHFLMMHALDTEIPYEDLLREMLRAAERETHCAPAAPRVDR